MEHWYTNTPACLGLTQGGKHEAINAVELRVSWNALTNLNLTGLGKARGHRRLRFVFNAAFRRWIDGKEWFDLCAESGDAQTDHRFASPFEV